tara:strand:- start:1205 stop:3154 length:1950 start_codon:yes stop_codon:yes gene_type:complete
MIKNEDHIDLEKQRLLELEDYFNEKFKKKINKVLFINPPDVDEKIFDFKIAKRGRANNYPSYGIGVLANQLRKLNYKADVLNVNHEVLKKVYHHEDRNEFDYLKVWQDIIYDRIKKFKPDLIGVSCLFSVTHNSFKKTCEIIKNGFNIPIILGGVHVSHDPKGVLSDIKNFDIALLYESDLALPNLLEIINKEKDISDIAQFAYRSKNKKIEVFNKRIVPDGHTMSVMPAYDLMDISNHSLYGTIGSWHGALGANKKVSTCQSNRGCRAQCTFCNVRTYHGKTVRHKTVDSVVDELLCLQNDYGIEHIVWLDDDLLKDEKRTINMFNEMVKRNVKLTWDATNGVIAHSLKKIEVVDAAYQSGCIGLHVGIESGNPEILKKIRKPGTVDTFIAASEVLKKFPKINTRALLMIGFPNETLGQIFDTIKLAETINFDWNNLAILQPWKGTPIYDEMSEDGLLGKEEGTLKTDDNDKAPYQLGTYSRQRAIEMGKIKNNSNKDKLEEGFLDRISLKDMNSKPSPKDLDDIWFYMNFRINFSRLLRETRPSKINQQYSFLNYVHNKTAPDNALIMYFYAYLEYKKMGKVSNNLIQKYNKRIKESAYWNERTKSLGLDVFHLTSNKFPSFIENAGIPKNFEGDLSKFHFPESEIC